MLNEIIALERGLVAAGFDVAPRHPDLSSPGRTEALRVRLDMAGQPVEVAGLERNRVAALWTLRNGKHNSFPMFSLDEGCAALFESAGAAVMGPPVQSRVVGVPLYFDVARDEFERDVADPSHAGPISAALSGGAAGSGATGTCLLTGQEARLHAGNFPQPSLPVLGQVYLFSKNGDIPAAARYGRADADGLPVGAELSQRLAGALDAITTADHRGWAWQSVPGERPKSADLLIALVKGVPEAPAAGVVAGGEEEVDDLDPAEAARQLAARLCSYSCRTRSCSELAAPVSVRRNASPTLASGPPGVEQPTITL